MIGNPGFLSHGIIQFWMVGMLLQLACLGLLVRRRLAVRHWGLASYLVLSSGVSLARLAGGLSSKTGYFHTYHATEWISVLATAALICGVWYECVVHYPAPRVLGVLLATFLGGGALVIAASLAGEAISGLWHPLSGAALARRGNVLLWALAFLLASRGIFHLISPLSANANRSLWSTIALALAGWASSEAARNGVSSGSVHVAQVGSGIVCSLLWMRLVPGGDERPPTAPHVPDEVLDATDNWIKRIIDREWRR